jgi:hypothetical protein
MTWHLTQLTPEAAETHDRRVYNAQPPTMLGWKPYTYRATRSAVSQFACHEDWQLKAQLKRHGLKVKAWTEWRDGVRTAQLIEA